MDFIKLPVTNKKVVRDHQGKGSVRVFGFQFGNAFRRGMAQGADAGNAAAEEMRGRIFQCQSYDSALSIIGDYVNITAKEQAEELSMEMN